MHGVPRVGKKRADVGHQMLDPVIVAGPWVLVGVIGYAGLRTLAGRL